MIKSTDSLSKEDIDALIFEEIIALHIKSFIDPINAKKLGSILSSDKNRSSYTHEKKEGSNYIQVSFGVDRVGVPFNMTYSSNNDSLDFYFQNKNYFLNLTRKYELAFIDDLRTQLDDIYGATRARKDGASLALGIGRIGHANEDMLYTNPHIDKPPAELLSVVKQFGANIYLNMPKYGGEIEIWDDDTPPTSVIDRNALHEPYVISPKEGDLVILNTRKPHAVKPHHKGERISASCFIGYEKDKPLQMWS